MHKRDEFIVRKNVGTGEKFYGFGDGLGRGLLETFV